MTQTKSEQAQALAHIPSGLYIISAKDRRSKKTDGYLASWLQQISFDPLLVCFAIKPDRNPYDLIMAGNPFSINIVGEHDRTYLKYFWSGYTEEKNPFNELEYSLGDFGGVILRQAKATLECEIVNKITPGDHDIVIAKVLSSTIQEEKAKPYVHFRTSGLDY